MENSNINPVGLKGRQINERMKELMGISSINENTTKSAVELTKIGPDGKAYAIVRENHEYYIKVADKSTNLLSEDFKYIGGLQNKKSEAYPSYAKAIKHLNLNFKSLAEAYGKGGDINVFVDDNLIKENAIVGGFSSNNGNGFSGAGNLEGDESLFEEVEESEDKDKDEVEMTEAEKAIDEMLTTEVRGPWSKNHNDTDDITNINGEESEDGRKINESRLSIELAIESMDDIIDALKKKVQ